MGEIVGAVIALTSLSSGYCLGRRHRSTSPSGPQELKCGCKHALAYRDKKTGRCHGWHTMAGYQPDQCTCRQYDGPVPYDTYVAREIT